MRPIRFRLRLWWTAKRDGWQEIRASTSFWPLMLCLACVFGYSVLIVAAEKLHLNGWYVVPVLLGLMGLLLWSGSCVSERSGFKSCIGGLKWYEWFGNLIGVSVIATLFFGGLVAPILLIWVVYPGWWIWPAVFTWAIAWMLFWYNIDRKFF